MKLNIVRTILLYIADIIKRHYLTGPTWLIAEGGYGAETTADQLERLGITTMTARGMRWMSPRMVLTAMRA